MEKTITNTTNDKMPLEFTIDNVPYIRKDTIKPEKVIEKEKVEERDYCCVDAANVMLIGKVHNTQEDSKDKPLHLMFDFIRDNSDLTMYMDLKRDVQIEIWKGEELWAKISKEYFDRARKIIKLWEGSPEIHVQALKNQPVLIRREYLGFVLAPQIEDDS